MPVEVFTMVVLIVALSLGAGIVNNYLKLQSRKKAGENDPALENELAELRQRVEVLEKIVTDEKYQLARDLNALES